MTSQKVFTNDIGQTEDEIRFETSAMCGLQTASLMMKLCGDHAKVREFIHSQHLGNDHPLQDFYEHIQHGLEGLE